MPLHPDAVIPLIDMNPEGAVTLLGHRVGRVIAKGLHPVHAARLLPHFMNHRQAQYEQQQQMLLQQPEAQVAPQAVLKPPSLNILSQARARELLLAAGGRIRAPEGIAPLSPDESAALFACFSAKQARQAMGPIDPQTPPRIAPEAQARLDGALIELHQRGEFQACGAAVAAGARIAHAPGNEIVQRAAMNGQLAALLPALMEGGARLEDIMRPTERGISVVHMAAQDGDATDLDALLRAGASMEQLLRPDAYGFTPLRVAAAYGKAEWVDAFVHAGLDLAALAAREGPRATTHAHAAAVEGNADFIRALGRYLGPEQLMTRTMDGKTPIHVAVEGRGEAPQTAEERDRRQTAGAAVIDALFQLGVPREEAVASFGNGFTAFHISALRGDLPCLRSLWHPSLAPEAVMAGGGSFLTPAHAASSANQPDVVRFLRHDAHIPLPMLLAPCTQGDSPIHLACQNGHVEVVRAWAEAGATPEDFTRPNHAGQTPFDRARANGHGAAIKAALMRAGVPEWQLVALPASPVAGAPQGAAPGPAL